jgi:flagellar biosynthesis anti-sigma factor FlgM
MTSRIDGNTGAPISEHNERTESTKAAERTQGQGTANAAKADPVELSSDAPLPNSEVQGAKGATPIRPDKVEAAKKALADGTLGADAGKLADALIDHVMDDKK